MPTERIAAGHLMRAVKGSYRSHQQLQDACLQLCTLRGVPARAIHTGPRVAPRGDGGFELRGNRAQAGVSDIMVCLPPHGRLALWEVKSGKARRSPEQVRVQQEFAAAGAQCEVIRSIEDAQRCLAGVPRSTHQGGNR